jgi:crossover junction endodeoxyribonuclease RuvC
MRILGVDPGLTGALAVFDTLLDILIVEDMPISAAPGANTKRKEVSAAWLTATIRAMAPDEAYVERVHALPKQGVSSVFSFGQSYGLVRGVLGGLAVPCHLITPQEWKRSLRLGADKSAARAMAANLFPASSERFRRVRDDGRAEAALLAWFGTNAHTSPRI